ncbi:hypothetical protein OGAPHI_001236 [Ogataea philodendri]|uniref:Uracil-DNA glycosylase n=1 Tax=Ogataea philodendri TaxID=1378263 RepID=A0A9P8PF27_9ASCO|nr:uncharacterized protein OGAPHI_001236 [Ogataea philodendri]KAH3670721.1 hypothetical protein OGAPHI_001236 [Ogataea philodendri]
MSKVTSKVAPKRAITDFFTVKRHQSSAVTKLAISEKKDTKKEAFVEKQITLQTVTTSTFDKQKWIDSLTPDQKDLLRLEIESMDVSWLSLIHQELTKPYFLNLKRYLQTEWKNQTIFPPKENVYSWTRLTPVDNVKVLVLGQDPYHNFNQAHGLAFSVQDPTPPPPSLKNIYKCLKKEYANFEIPKKGDLTKWASGGVLMLNTCLTVRAHNANSHSGRGWEQFTMQVIKKLIEHTNRSGRGLAIVAWGSPAQKTVANAGPINWSQNLFLKSVHPSPLSASRGFFDCHHFTKCNAWLAEKYGADAQIDWALVDGNSVLHT